MLDTHGAVDAKSGSPLEITSRFMEDAPVDLSGISHALGLRVSVNSDMDSSLSGLITRDPASESGFRIEVNGNHSPYRQRFTLAHEIAHYLLHREIIGEGVLDNAMYRSALSDHFEVQANSLAANILMPSKLLRRVYKAGLKSLNGLQLAFQVSEDAMRIRLRQLGLAP